jgi:hypothetical protein
VRGCRAGSGSSDRCDRGERVAEGGAGVRGVHTGTTQHTGNAVAGSGSSERVQ